MVVAYPTGPLCDAPWKPQYQTQMTLALFLKDLLDGQSQFGCPPATGMTYSRRVVLANTTSYFYLTTGNFGPSIVSHVRL